MLLFTRAGDVVETDWQRVIRRLADKHPAGARVAVYPDLTVQYIQHAGAA
jgi:hypothetical protein